MPLFCFPRHVDSAAFYLDRTDLQVWRSKDLGDMFRAMDAYKTSVILFGHRNSKTVLTENLPPHFRVVHIGKLGVCSVAVIEEDAAAVRHAAKTASGICVLTCLRIACHGHGFAWR